LGEWEALNTGRLYSERGNPSLYGACKVIDYSQGPFPDLSTKVYRPFWEETKEGRLAFPRCADCGKFHWYPMRLCPGCRSERIEWAPVAGRGRIFTWTVVRYPFLQEFQSRLPYIVALVEFPDAPGVRLVTNIIEASPEETTIDALVEVVFHRVNDEIVLPLFRLVKE